MATYSAAAETTIVVRRGRFVARRLVAVLAFAAVLATTASSAATPRRPSRPEVVAVAAAVAGRVSTGPIGSLDAVRVDPATGDVRVIGWAGVLGRVRSVEIELSAHGRPFATIDTGQRRADVEAVYGALVDPGFDAILAVPEDAHTICADAVHPRSQTRVRLGCGAVDASAADATSRALDDVLHTLGRQAERRLDGVTVALAVTPFDTGRTVGWRANRLFISASTPKSWWTAAALANGQARAAAALADRVFQESSDVAAGAIIDLAGGIDAVNDFTSAVGMDDTAVIKWSFASDDVSVRFPGPLGGSNHVDANDATRFFYALGTNQILRPRDTRLLSQWMRRSPRSAADSRIASTIPDSLPPRVRRRVEHKSGWLEPGRYSVPAHLLDTGIVRPGATDPPYAIALMAVGGDGPTYDRLIEFFQSASCQIYLHLTDADWTCPGW